MIDIDKLHHSHSHLKELIIQVDTSIENIKDKFTPADFDVFMTWCFDEYKNLMVVSSEDFKDTLIKITNTSGRIT